MRLHMTYVPKDLPKADFFAVGILHSCGKFVLCLTNFDLFIYRGCCHFLQMSDNVYLNSKKTNGGYLFFRNVKITINLCDYEMKKNKEDVKIMFLNTYP